MSLRKVSISRINENAYSSAGYKVMLKIPPSWNLATEPLMSYLGFLPVNGQLSLRAIRVKQKIDLK